MDPTAQLTTSTLPPGAVVLEGRFKVLRLLGAGGMGEVYLAEQVSLRRKVALKVLRQDLSLQPGMRERFEREALLLSSVDHASVVRVIDFGTSGGAPVLVMELVEGEPLDHVLRRERLSPPRALSILAQLADGLTAIHAQGIVHRDLKPENVILATTARGEQARLLDFGIARLAKAEDTPSVTQAGIVIGTPEYLSPEQVLGQPPSPRSDIYSFGVLAYRLLTGSLPLPGPSARELMVQHLGTPPRPIEEAEPALASAPELAALVMSCLQKDPAHRPPSAAAIADMMVQLAVASRPIEPADGAGEQHPSTPREAWALARPRPTAERPALPPAPEQAVLLSVSMHPPDAGAASAENLLLPVIRAYRGRVVQRGGARLLALHPSATQAVHCGMAIQDRMYRHNFLLPEDEHLRAAVAVHAGEAVRTPAGVEGPAVAQAAGLEPLLKPGDVLFTEPVRAELDPAGVPAQPGDECSLPGLPAPTRTFRCVPASEGAPYGGRDLKAAADQADALQALALTSRKLAAVALERGRDAMEVVRRGTGRMGVRVRVAAAAAAALAIALGAVVAVRSRSVEQRAARFLEAKEFERALNLLEVRGPRGDPEVALLRARALHGLKQHREEAEVLAALPAEAWESAGAVDFEGPLDDYARAEQNEQLRAVLAAMPRSELESIAEDRTVSWQQWGALRFLHQAGRAEGLDLSKLYRRYLTAPECRLRANAAWHLGELLATDALEDLERLADTPKRTINLFMQENCGQDEARAAIRQLRRGAGR